MKSLRIRQFFFGLAIMCSLASYIYLSAQQSESPASPRETVSVTTEEKKEVLLPDMALLKKLIDLGKMFSNYSTR